MPLRTEDLIHFDGRFAPGEVERLSRTTETIEHTLRLAPVPPLAGRPWIMVSVEIPSYGTYFLAHRLGYPHFLRARTVEELCHQIRTTWIQSIRASHRSGCL